MFARFVLPHRPRHRWRVAVASARRMLADPQDVPAILTFVSALPGVMPWVLHDRFHRSPQGRKLLAERPQLLDAVQFERLERLPPHSLGGAYFAFLQRSNVSPEGLERAFVAAGNELADDDEWRYIEQRGRVSHDLWHTVLGYEADLVGEMAIAIFTAVQTGNLGLAAFSLAWCLRQGPFALDDPRLQAGHAIIRGAAARAWRASPLCVAPWEELLACDLEGVRERLGVGAAPSYTPVGFHDLADWSRRRTAIEVVE